MEKNAPGSIDLRSGILLRDKTRVATEDEIMVKVKTRDFVPIE